MSSDYSGIYSVSARCKCGAILDLTAPADEMAAVESLAASFTRDHLLGGLGAGHGSATVAEARNARRRWAASRTRLIKTTLHTIARL